MVLIVTLLGMLLLSSIGAGLSMTSTTEVMVTASARRAQETRYAAQAAVERVIDDLHAEPDWNALVSAGTLSTFVDGAASGPRALSDGSTIDLDQIRNLANCRNASGCTLSAIQAATTTRPWGTRNPVWRLYAYAPVAGLAPSSNAVSYAVVLLAGDPASSPDTIWLRGLAFGPRGATHTVEVALMRDGGEVRVLSWRDIR